MPSSCRTATATSFGPLAEGCGSVFDFTLLFEETILFLSPMIIALFLGIFRLSVLRKQEKLIARDLRYYLKMMFYAILTSLDLALTFVVALSPTVITTDATIAVSAIAVFCSAGFLYLSCNEHERSTRPSSILTVYTLASIAFDVVRVRTLWLLEGQTLVAAIFTTRLAIKACLFILENTGDRCSLAREKLEVTAEERSGIINRALLWFMNPLFRTGHKKLLVLDDLSPLEKWLTFRSRDLGTQMREDPVNTQSKKKMVTFILRGRLSLLVIGFVTRCLLLGVKFAQPLLVNRVTTFLSNKEQPARDDEGVGLAVAYAVVYVGIAIIGVLYQSNAARLMAALRGSLTALLYRRTICQAGASAADKGAATLISADMEKVVHGFATAHELWANLVEMGLFMWILVNQLGASSVAGILVMILCIGINLKLTATASGRQAMWFESINDRVTTTINAITSMKGLKLTGNTDRVRDSISQLRDREIKQSQHFRKLLIFLFTLTYTSSTLSPVFAFGTYSIISLVRSSEPLTASVAFTSLTTFTLLSSSITSWINSVLAAVTANGSLGRIHAHMNTTRGSADTNNDSKGPTKKEPPSKDPEDDQIDQRQYESGILLGSLVRSTDGSGNAAISLINVNASWEEDWHPTIHDISLSLPRSKLTMVIGPVGCGKTTLLKAIIGEVPFASGFVTLDQAQLGYCDQTPWLTNATARENIIGMNPWDATWYATAVQACELHHDFRQLPLADETIVGTNGTVLSGGQKARIGLARVVYSRERIAILDNIFSGLDATTEQQVWNNLLGSKGLLHQRQTTVVMATNSANNLPSADHIVVLGEKGTVVEQGTYEKLLADGGYVSGLDVKEQSVAQEERLADPLVDRDAQAAIIAATTDGANGTDLVKTSDRRVYWYYAKVIGRTHWVIFAGLCVIFVLGISFPNVWIQEWTSENVTRPNARLAFYLSIYASIGLLAVGAFLTASTFFMLKIVPRSARKFHYTLLDTVLNAPMSFFDQVDIGETCNRFSQDLQLIDTELPLALISTTISLISCIVQFVVVIIGSNYTGIIMPFIFAAIVLVLRFYLRTSRRLRILDIESRGSVLSHFLSFLTGGPTIRAFGWTRPWIDQAYRALEECQKPFYFLALAQQWLNLVLDLLNAGLAVTVVSIAVSTRMYSSGLTGLALQGIVGFSQNVKSFVSTWTALELAIGAVARIRHLANSTKSEHLPDETHQPPQDWPSKGHIVFEGVEVSYRHDMPSVLKGISFEVHPGQRLGICGRTGSGKSSIVSALLRLVDTTEGIMRVDGIDITTVPRNELRQRFVTLPQEPFLAHGTIRENLDPSGTITDDKLIATLSRFRLWNTARPADGLDRELTYETFSHGQRQLFCLAQASLRTGGKILVMDESTSSVDQDMDDLMQRILREDFQDYTIISIAHKIHTILDFDLIAVIDDGRVLELDSPAALLAREDSEFSELYRQSGKCPSTMPNDRRLSQWDGLAMTRQYTNICPESSVMIT